MTRIPLHNAEQVIRRHFRKVDQPAIERTRKCGNISNQHRVLSSGFLILSHEKRRMVDSKNISASTRPRPNISLLLVKPKATMAGGEEPEVSETAGVEVD